MSDSLQHCTLMKAQIALNDLNTLELCIAKTLLQFKLET